MAYVVITHLHPGYESHLPEILQSHTRMPVTQVTELVKVEPNHVYVIPPNRRMVMADSKLDVAEFDEPRGHRTPIDLFFRSLASSHPDSAAIILSGSWNRWGGWHQGHQGKWRPAHGAASARG